MSGPIEAAKKYLERQRVPITDAAPSASTLGPASNAATGQNGHSGDSIEAGLDFEATYQYETQFDYESAAEFETAFEADATEDWVDLRGSAELEVSEAAEIRTSGLDGRRLAAPREREAGQLHEANALRDKSSPFESHDGAELREDTDFYQSELQRRLQIKRLEEVLNRRESVGVFRPASLATVRSAGNMSTNAGSADTPDSQAVRAAISRLVREANGARARTDATLASRVAAVDESPAGDANTDVREEVGAQPLAVSAEVSATSASPQLAVSGQFAHDTHDTQDIQDTHEFANVARWVWGEPVASAPEVDTLSRFDRLERLNRCDSAESLNQVNAETPGIEMGLEADDFDEFERTRLADRSHVAIDSAMLGESSGRATGDGAAGGQLQQTSPGTGRVAEPAVAEAPVSGIAEPGISQACVRVQVSAEVQTRNLVEVAEPISMPRPVSMLLPVSILLPVSMPPRVRGLIQDAAWDSQDLPPGPIRERGQSRTEDLRGRGLTDGSALAHDAGNLLSALKLYSELLSLSGVLQERHRHYAEDLKLLAGRSQVLIERLLQSSIPAGRWACDSGQAVLDSAATSMAETALSAQELSRLQVSKLMSPERYSVSISTADEEASAVAADRVDPAIEGAAPLSATLLTEQSYPVAGQALKIEANGRAVSERAVSESAVSDSAVSDSAVSEIATSEIATSETARPLALGSEGPARKGLSGVTQDVSEEVQEPIEVARALEEHPANEARSINMIDLLTRWGSLLSMIARGSVQVKFGPRAGLPVPVSEEALERILVNLVHNAMTATRGGGEIRIGVGRADKRSPVDVSLRSERGQTMVLTVDDSGCGMTEERVARLMGSDRRTDTALHAAEDAGHGRQVSGRKDAVGLAERGVHRLPGGEVDRRRRGMGLQIVRELVVSSGGRLSIYSRPGVGTRIEIEWQTGEATVQPDRVPSAPLNLAAAGSSRSEQGTGRGEWQNPVADRAPKQPWLATEARSKFERRDREGAIAC